MKRIFKTFLGLALAVTLASCGGDTNDTSSTDEVTLVVGATVVPHAKLLELVEGDLLDLGIKLEIREFSDYVLLNPATASGDLDANFFQHQPFLDSYNEDSNNNLVNVGNIHLEPMRVYSEKIISINDLQDGAKVGVPNDASNEGRALLVLQELGLIKLSDNAGILGTVNDIIENPKNLEIIELDSALIPRSLDNLDIALINTNIALEANVSSDKVIATESKDSPYANIVVTTEEKKDDESIKKLLEVLQSDKVRSFIEEEYEGAVVPAF